MLTNVEGKRLNGPNDVWNDKFGGMYFTDPLYERDYWINFKKETPHKSLYYRNKDGAVTKLKPLRSLMELLAVKNSKIVCIRY